MTHASLFSGLGGFDYAAKCMKWTNIFNCEKNKFCTDVLKYHYPKALHYDDIKDTDFTIWRGKIDVLTGGFPCQPFSKSGKRKGTEDNRYLWPQMLRAIREIQPRWIVGENVFGIINWSNGLVFEQICTDLENEGYEVQPYLLPAIAVNAPHRRDRVWFVAHTDSHTNRRQENLEKKDTRRLQENKSKGLFQSKKYNSLRQLEIRDAQINFTNADSFRSRELQNTKETSRTQNGNEIFTSKCSVSDWNGFPTQPPVCSRNDGLSSRLHGITFSKWRNESIKAYGNAIVPQVALQIFKTIKETENYAIHQKNSYR